MTQPEFIAGRAFNSMLYGTHPYALSSTVEPESIAALRREDLVGFYRAHYRADHAVVALIGDVTIGPGEGNRRSADFRPAARREGEPQPLAGGGHAQGGNAQDRPSRHAKPHPHRSAGHHPRRPRLFPALCRQLRPRRRRLCLAPDRGGAAEARAGLQRLQLFPAAATARAVPDRPADQARAGGRGAGRGAQDACGISSPRGRPRTN